MQITKLLTIYLALIPKYEDALHILEIAGSYPLDRQKGIIAALDLYRCIIYAAYFHVNDIVGLHSLFASSGYYQAFITDEYPNRGRLKYIVPEDARTPEELRASLQFRLDFLKAEISELKALLKEGYTHV